MSPQPQVSSLTVFQSEPYKGLKDTEALCAMARLPIGIHNGAAGPSADPSLQDTSSGKGSSYQVFPRPLKRNGGSHLLLVSWGPYKLWVLLPQFASCSTCGLSCGLGPWLLGFRRYLGWRGCACQAWVRHFLPWTPFLPVLSGS